MKIDYTDKKTWDLICAGHTKGVFQCESRLVQQWLKRIKPKNVWELSAVIAIVRPGPLVAGFADTYVEYKNGTKEFESFGHPIIDSVFDLNHHILLYQENLMALGARLAWPDLPEKEKKLKVDLLRKAVGKKNQQKVMEIGRDFVEGCVRNKVEQVIADKLFEIIKGCGRYLFNLSHSIKYAHIAYETAYAKANHPLQFYATYLSYAKFRPFKWDEMSDLIREARVLGTNILVPSWNEGNLNFKINNGEIIYGLSHLKHGPRSIQDLPKIHTLQEFIKFAIEKEKRPQVRSNSMIALISVGAFSGIGYSRRSLLTLFHFLEELTGKESGILLDRLNGKREEGALFEAPPAEFNLDKIIEDVAAGATKKRQETVRSMWTLVKLNEYDHPQWIQETEMTYLGTFITAVKIDDKAAHMSINCKDCMDEWKKYSKVSVACVIEEVKHTKTKKGKNPGQDMATINVFDSTGELQGLPVFPEKYNQYCTLLIPNNTVVLNLLYGNTGWIIDSMDQL